VAAPVAAQEVVEVTTAAELQDALASPLEDVVIKLAAGEYRLSPSDAVDATCGNCEDPAQEVPITLGVRISGRAVTIEGPALGEAVIYTNAGYGLLFEDCNDCRLKNVTITGGVRDESPDATDAAVVVRRGTVHVQGCTIRDNVGDPALLEKNVVGIIGVCGREGSTIFIFENRILGNSWDGIALYRDADARIFKNLIDGVDRARGKQAGGGRGVGVGVTWNAKARIEYNLIRRYWKGVGVFVDAQAQIVNNIIEEMLTWGIAYWDAGKGRPSAAIGGNIVYDCGACGVLIARTQPLESGEYASFTGNAVVKTGQDPDYDDPEKYCSQCAVALEAAPDAFQFTGNLFHDNRRGSDDLPDYDVTETMFRNQSARLVGRIVGPSNAYRARNVFLESSFLKTYAGR
jgi:hypothetical protein